VKSLVIATVVAVLAVLSGPVPAQGTGTPVTGRVLGAAIHARDADELRAVVLQPLVDHYADEQGIVATPAEVDAYVRSVQQFLRGERDRLRARRADLTAQLQAPGLAAPRRDVLTAELDAANQALAALGDLDASSADPEDTKARREIGAAFVRQWKINTALHRQYGGRVVLQQAGPEPLDAYRRFLEERRARGDFVIADPALEAAFWRYFRDDSIHSFYPAGSREEAEAFRTPPWQVRPAD
jgi:hypothetical protein